MVDFRRVDINAEPEYLLKISGLNTSFLSVNPYLDNRKLILKKLNRNEVNIYSIFLNNNLEGVFLIKNIPYNSEAAYIDYLLFTDKEDQDEAYLLDFLYTIFDIFNIKRFIKCEEINDQRITSFKKVGFTEIAELRDQLFYDGTYHTQKLYYMNMEDALIE